LAEAATILTQLPQFSNLLSAIVGVRLTHTLVQAGGRITLTPASFIGCLSVAFGGWLRWKCYRTLSGQFTFLHTVQKKHTLVTHGPYSIVRHPSYLATTFVWVGLGLWHGSKGSWLRESGFLTTMPGMAYGGAFGALLIALKAALYSRMPKEDAELRRVFGEEWETYAKRVPYRLIPGLV
jgi:protein-S-isoprenylcysteine O-methyltransferase Ste14